MDPSAPLTVAQGVIITSATTALFTSIVSIFRGQVTIVGPLATSSAINGGIAGATFFSFREYVVSPILVLTVPTAQYMRRRRELGAARDQPGTLAEKLSWADMRMHKLPDSALSGAFTGGLLNAWKRGRAGVVPGVTTAGLLCTLLQLAYNELGVLRVRYVARKLRDSQFETHSAAPQEPVLPRAQRFLDALGLNQLSDEQYIDMMKKKRDGYLARIAELEKQRTEKIERTSPESSASEKPSA